MFNTKFIKIEGHPYDEGYHYNMVKSGVNKVRVDFINPNEISSITRWEGESLLKGKVGTKITMKNKDTFVDARCVDNFLNYLMKIS